MGIKIEYSAEWKENAIQLSDGGMSWRAIAKQLGVARSTCSDFLRQHYAKPTEVSLRETATHEVRAVESENNQCILVISDMHIPYHHPDTFVFLKALKDKYNPTRIVCMGDELDKHALSYHDHDPDLPSAGDELARALPFIAELEEMFPVMNILDSNHGSLVWRKAKTHGIPKAYIKDYNQVLQVGKGWKWSFDLTLTLPTGQKCYFHHGKTADVVGLSQTMGMNAVQGHYHEKLKVEYWGNPSGLFWGLQTGCLIDDKSLAFSYNNVNLKRPVIGTAVIVNGLPVVVPMVLNSEGRWIGSL